MAGLGSVLIVIETSDEAADGQTVLGHCAPLHGPAVSKVPHPIVPASGLRKQYLEADSNPNTTGMT